MLYICPAYYNKIALVKNIRLISTPSRTLFVSYKALRLLSKRTGLATYLISTSLGILPHKEALRKRIGGILLGFVFI
jgi:ribosomal protein S8